MGYSATTTLQLIGQLYGHYARISTTDVMANDANLREQFNPDDPLKSLYTRLNECVNYATTTGDTTT